MTLSDNAGDGWSGDAECVSTEAVINFISNIKNHIIAKQGFTNYVQNGNEIIEFIDKEAGADLI